MVGIAFGLMGHSHTSEGECEMDSCSNCISVGCVDGMLYRQVGDDLSDVEQDGPCACPCHPPSASRIGFFVDDGDEDDDEQESLPF